MYFLSGLAVEKLIMNLIRRQCFTLCRRYSTLLVDANPKTKVRKITLNRPDRFNAFNTEMFNELPQALSEAAEDDSTLVTVITGQGSYYSSGNDINNLVVDVTDQKAVAELAGKARDTLQGFVASFIDFPKLLVAAVNGPAIGIAYSTLALCDVVYASEKATFYGPFVTLGQAPEGCSSYLFPRIMGPSLSHEVMYLARKLDCKEALKCGFVSKSFPAVAFEAEVDERTIKMAQIPPLAFRGSKSLVRGHLRAKLHQVNQAECELLYKLWKSPECWQAIADFMTRKQKS